MKKQFKFLTIAIMTALVSQSAMAMPAPSGFTDIDYDNEYYNAASYLRENDVINGYKDGSYRPDRTVSRAEFTKILISTVKNENEITGSNCFPDIKSTDWSEKYICTAKEMGVIDGYKDGEFKPNEPIKFIEAAKIIAKVMYNTPDEYPPCIGEVCDVEEPVFYSNWYGIYVDVLSGRKSIPTSISSFSKKITRGEMAEMIYRLDTDTRNKPNMDYNPALNTLDSPSCMSREYTGLEARVKTFNNEDIIGASILVNGQIINLNLLQNGTYDVTATADGYGTHTQEVTVDYAGQNEYECPKQETTTIYLQSAEELELFYYASKYCEEQDGEVDESWPIGGFGMPARNTASYSCLIKVSEDSSSRTMEDLYDFYKQQSPYYYENLEYDIVLTLPSEMSDAIIETLIISEETNTIDANGNFATISFKFDDTGYLTLFVSHLDGYDEHRASIDGAYMNAEFFRNDKYVFQYEIAGYGGAIVEMPNKDAQSALIKWFDEDQYTVNTVL